MRKLIVLLTIFLLTGCTNIVNDSIGEVYYIEKIGKTLSHSRWKYKVKVKLSKYDYEYQKEYTLYTNTLYGIGDTIIIK